MVSEGHGEIMGLIYQTNKLVLMYLRMQLKMHFIGFVKILSQKIKI